MIAKRFVVVTIMIGCVFLATGAASSFAEDQPSVTAPNSTLPPSSTVMKVIAETPYYQHGPTFDSYLPVDGKSRHPALILMQRLKIEGFIVSEHMEVWPAALAELGGLVASGKLRARESIALGLENAPEAFLGLLKGKNFGKQLVKLI